MFHMEHFERFLLAVFVPRGTFTKNIADFLCFNKLILQRNNKNVIINERLQMYRDINLYSMGYYNETNLL